MTMMHEVQRAAFEQHHMRVVFHGERRHVCKMAMSEPHQNLHVPSRSSVPHGVPGAHALQRVSMVSYSKCWKVDGAWCRCCDGANDMLVDGNGGWWLRLFERMLPHVRGVQLRCVAPARRLE